MFLALFICMVFSAAMFTAVIRDASTMTIPNWASLLVLGGFMLVIPFIWSSWAAAGSPWLTLGEHVAVGLTIFAAGFAMFAFGWLGGGDAKLMAATAFWWQWTDLLQYLFYTTLAGGVLALFLIFGRKFIPAKALTLPWLHRLLKDETRMPYGLALAFGALVTLPQSEIFKAALGIN